MQRTRWILSLCFALISISALSVAQRGARPQAEDLQWLQPNDPRLEWTNVADWESRTGGLQPVRVPKQWREKWPRRTAFRALSAAGMAVRFRTDAKKIVFRLTFLDAPEPLAVNPEVTWELSRPPYFDVYRNGKYLSSVPAKNVFYEQDVTLFDAASPIAQLTEPAGSAESEFMILPPHYYRNAQVVLAGIGIDKGAQLHPAEARRLPVVLFHGGSITHGHGVLTPRDTFVWQSCEMAQCIPINLGFGGSAWGDSVVADYIASRTDWDAFVLNMGQNSIGGSDSAGNPETVAQYAKKYDEFISIIRARYPTKPIIALTPILSRDDILHVKNRNGEYSADYRRVMQEAVTRRQKTDPNLYFIDGLKLVNDPLYLWPTDQVHPNMAGTLKLAEGVAEVLKTALAKQSTRAGQAK